MITALMSKTARGRRKLAACALTMFLSLAATGAANAQGMVVSSGAIELSGLLQDQIQIDGWLHVVV